MIEVWILRVLDVFAAALGLMFSVVLLDLIVFIIKSAPKSRCCTDRATTLAYFMLPIIYFYFTR